MGTPLQAADRRRRCPAYVLTRLGFEVAQATTGRRGTYIDPAAAWREPIMSDARRILRSLHVNGWVLAFEARAGKLVRAWRGPRESRLEPPRRRVRGEWIDIGRHRRLREPQAPRLAADSFEPVTPDATLELRVPAGDSHCASTCSSSWTGRARAVAAEDRLRRYDGLISGWSGMLDRYRTLGTPPVVVRLRGRAPRAGAPANGGPRGDRTAGEAGHEETEWPHPARRAMFFAVDRDIHSGSLEAFQLPSIRPTCASA